MFVINSKIVYLTNSEIRCPTNSEFICLTSHMLSPYFSSCRSNASFTQSIDFEEYRKRSLCLCLEIFPKRFELSEVHTLCYTYLYTKSILSGLSVTFEKYFFQVSISKKCSESKSRISYLILNAKYLFLPYFH